MSLPPGPSSPTPLQTWQWGYRPIDYLLRARRKFGDTFTMRLGRLGPIVQFSHPDAVRQIFTSDTATLHGGEANILLEPVFGRRSLMLLDDDEHLRHRRLLLPPFHGERLKGYVAAIAAITNDVVDDWRSGDTFTMVAQARTISLNVILRVTFGINEQDGRDRFQERLDALDPNLFRGFVFLADRLPIFGRFDPGLRFALARQALSDLVLEQVELRRRTTETDSDDVLTMLLQAEDEDGNPLTNEELCDELITIIISGYETTAFSLAWTLELLYHHPEVMDRAVAAAVAGEDDYIEALLKESLRLRPILPMVVRRVTKPIEIGGVPLDPGTTVAANIFLSHIREETYGDPQVFRPERFLEDAADGYSWFPFGGGVRRCIGVSFAMLEMRVMLKAILARATLRSPDSVEASVVKRAFSFAPKHDARTIVVQVQPAGA